MGISRSATLAALVMVPLLGGCENQQQTGGLLGGLGGATAGGLIGHAIGGSAGTAIGMIVGGGAGFLVGSSIGKRLDEQDRARAENATQQALAAPVTYPSNSATTAPPPRPVAWNSARNTDVRGSSTVTSVQRESNGGECRMVRETAYIKGEEVVQNNRYCRGGDGQWVART